MIRRILQALLCCICFNLHAAQTRVVFPQYFTADTGSEFDWIVLRTALRHTVASHGPYTLKPWGDRMSVARMVEELATNDGRINVIARATDRELETRFQPIRIPIDRGLMGMRLLLVRKADLGRFASVRTLHDLRRLSAGQGKGWVDAEVLSAAGISVVEAPRPDALMGMLEGGRFDFFPRALDEAAREYDANRKVRPNIVIEPTLMLRYPLPRYFFVRRDAEGDRLARRIEAGMEKMVRDGTLEALFRQHKGRMVQQARIGRRHVIELPNPTLPPETPLQRRELWLK